MSAQPTQARYPWRATLRTVVAASVGLLSLLPVIAVTAHVDTVPLIAQMLTVSGAITRVLAIPGVNTWLHQYKLASWLAANPPPADAPEPRHTLAVPRTRWPESPEKRNG